MYPAIGTFSSDAGRSQAPHGGPGRWPQAPYNNPYAHQTPLGVAPPGPPGAVTNGPLPSSSPSSSVKALRVKVTDEYSLPPPVNTAASSDVPSTQFQFDFEFEKKLLARHGAAGDSSMHVSDDGQGQSCGQDKAGVLFDPWEESINQYGHMGYSKEEVCMALCACGGNQEQIATFCQNYRKLKELGYAPAIITGALIIHRGNFDAALHMCLDIS